jgi:hypothetical protein
VPPNGFMVQAQSSFFVSDNGTPSPQQNGFFVVNTQVAGSMFVTPPGYKPIGVVSVLCPGIGTVYIAARAW